MIGEESSKVNDACREKIIIPTQECASGMTLMQSIVDENTGTVIVAKGQTLNAGHIDRLRNFNHTQIWVKIDEEATFWDIDPQIYNQYRTYAKVLKYVFEKNEGISFAKVQEVIGLAKKIVRDAISDYHLLGCISLLPRMEKDIYIHSVNVAFLSLLVGKWQGYDTQKQEELVISALLHDVGKLQINPQLNNKGDKTKNLGEKLEYMRHPILGYEILASFNELSVEILKGVLSHHECIDGSGYPLSLEAEMINDYAKIIGIVDTYDHLKEEYHIFDAIKQLGSICSKKFSTDILLEFCHNVVNYYIGSHVLLSNGEVGEVVFIQSQAIYKPIVKVGNNKINLYEQTDIHVVKVL